MDTRSRVIPFCRDDTRIFLQTFEKNNGDYIIIINGKHRSWTLERKPRVNF